jgi:hypothetical protein
MHRAGLTKIEVTLAVVIVAMIAALVLPAIIRAREAEARSQSSNNLKQIIFACHSYNDGNKNRLPPLLDVGEGAPTGGGLQSLFFHILPYLGDQHVYLAFNRAAPGSYISKTYGAAQNLVPTFISPADATSSGGALMSQDVALPEPPPGPYAQSFTGWYATTSYAANGIIPWNTGTMPRTFVDGTSNTIAFAERPQVCADAAADRTVYNLWGFGYYGHSTPAYALLTPAEPKGLPSTDQIAAAVPLPQSFTQGMMPIRIGREDAKPQPSRLTRSFQLGLTRGGPCDSRLAGSPHRTGMLVAVADGSARSLAPQMSDWTFWAVCTPAGNETPYNDIPD